MIKEDCFSENCKYNSSKSKFTKVLYPNHIGENITSLNGITKKYLKKIFKQIVLLFYGFTTQNAIRDEPFEFQDTQIYISFK